MRIKLTSEEVAAITRNLSEKNAAHFKYDGKDLYVRLDKIVFKESDSKLDHVLHLEDATSAITEDLKSRLGEYYIFTTVARNKFEEIFKTGEIITVFYFSNSRFEAAFPEELIDPSECDVRVVGNRERK